LCIDIVVRFLTSPDRRNYWRRAWIDLIVLVPIVGLFSGVPAARIAILVRQFVALCTGFWRSDRTARLISQLGLRPAQLIVITFAAAILVGTILLDLPLASAKGESIGFVNAVFTATSATCVTGLIVLETGKDFSIFGQIVILCLIQIGALGIMTFSAILLLLSRGRMTKRYEAQMQAVLGHESLAGVQEMVGFILKMTMITELIGAVLLVAAWGPTRGLCGRTIYEAVFHAISAFCNAGFSLFSSSLEKWQPSISINAIMSSLIIVGGLGFLVVRDLARLGRHPFSSRRGFIVQTKVVLLTSAILIAAGMTALLVAERNGVHSGVSWQNRLLGAYFQSVTARTAGFNTLSIKSLTEASRWAIIALMFVGASPGSTGGGVKTTTVAVLIIWMRSALRNRDEPEAFRRRISMSTAQRAVCIIGFGIALVVLGVFVLSVTESGSAEVQFDDVCFEVTSAFGTVGLSTGITPALSTAGRLLITVVMFVGRIGPLTLALAIAGGVRRAAYRYAEETVLVG